VCVREDRNAAIPFAEREQIKKENHKNKLYFSRQEQEMRAKEMQRKWEKANERGLEQPEAQVNRSIRRKKKETGIITYIEKEGKKTKTRKNTSSNKRVRDKLNDRGM